MADCTFDPGTPEQESCLVKEALKAVESAVKAVEADQTGLEEVSGFLQALSGILLPLAAILFLVLMIGPIRELIATRKFTIKIAGFELSAQEASEQLRKEIDDLRKKVCNGSIRPPLSQYLGRYFCGRSREYSHVTKRKDSVARFMGG